MPTAMRTIPLLLAASLTAAPALAAPTLLIDHANGLQVSAAGKIERFTGLLIGGDGRVVKVLKVGAPRPPAAQRIDVHGATLLPGLIDAHGHVMGLGQGLLALDVTGTRSIVEMQARLKAYAAANPSLKWIVGRGWNQELWSEKRMPTTADIDAAVRDRPVWLERVDGHAAVGNSRALAEAGITAATKAPAGGRIENGLFTDNARGLVDAHIPAPAAAELDAALGAAQQALLADGLTAVADMGTDADGWAAMRRAGDSGRLKVRIMSYAFGIESMNRLVPNGPTPWLYAGRLHMGGVKLYADGALGSRGAWLKADYSDRPGTRGLPLLDPPTLNAAVAKATARGLQVATHAIGDAANAMVIDAYEQANRAHPGDRRWRIEHAQVVDPIDIPRIARSGIIASMQPTHQTSDMNMAGDRLGEARLAGAYAWRTIRASGARMAFGSDFPVESPNPFPGLSAAISRSDPNGQPPGGWRPQERMTLPEALAGFTRWAAYAGFAEKQIGSLDPGHYADFILIDRDPTRVDAVSLAATRVNETWVGGKRVYARASGGTPAR